MLSRKQEHAILRSVRPKMVEISLEIEQEFYPEIPFDEGQLFHSAYVKVDELGTIEFGYNEEGRGRPHGLYVEAGTSDTPAQPVIRKTASKKRRRR